MLKKRRMYREYSFYIVVVFWFFIAITNAYALTFYPSDEYVCCEKLLDPAYQVREETTCENQTMSREACQEYVDEQNRDMKEALREFEKPAWIAFFIILGIFLFAVIGVGVVLYWLICALRKWLGKKQKKNVRKR